MTWPLTFSSSAYRANVDEKGRRKEFTERVADDVASSGKSRGQHDQGRQMLQVRNVNCKLDDSELGWSVVY